MTWWPALAVAALFATALANVAGAQERTAASTTAGRQAAPVSGLQADIALRMRRALVSDANFIARVAAFHSTNPTRFAGLEVGRQKQLVEDYLKAARVLPWSVGPDGTMRRDEWDRRESAAIFKLETEPDFLARVAVAEGLKVEELAAGEPLQLARRIRAHVVPVQAAGPTK